MALSNHYRSEDLLDVDTAAGGFQQRQGLKYCLPLTFCIHTGLSQYIAVEAAEGRNKNEVFYQCPVSRKCVLCGLKMWFDECINVCIRNFQGCRIGIEHYAV